jgi:UDP-perosamine 4-acetyltransferase
MTDILVVGGGGHAKVVIAALLGAGAYNVAGYTAANSDGPILGVPRLGDDDIITGFARARPQAAAAIGVGMVGATTVRRRIETALQAAGLALPVVRALSARVFYDVEVAAGSFIGDGVVVNPSAKIGRCAILNTRCVVEHDVVIGDHVHLSPASVVCGGASVGSDCWIGAAAVIVHSVRIAPHCIVGAGAVVTHDLSSSGTYVGAPARRVA